ncbi:DNA-processing protein DprA [Patescibacteria group bacterium]|nr:DNA-processing protein DprA [Patescibacteria group bacterium]
MSLPHFIATTFFPQFGAISLMRIFRSTDAYEDIWRAPKEHLLSIGLKEKAVEQFISWRGDQDPQALYLQATAHDTTVITCNHPEYPPLLATIHDPPPVLFVRGKLGDIRQSVAIVGSRSVTPDGRRATALFAQACAQMGAPVVSGLAEGVDHLAHEETLKAGGRTIAVLASGLDAMTGHERRTLAARITEHGAIISELPASTPAAAFRFPIRNRLVAGMTRATVVIEAALKSGSLITAKAALEAGRDVYAVPGSIFNPNASGTNALLKDGALFATSAQDLFPASAEVATTLPPTPKPVLHLTDDEARIVELLVSPKNSADICDALPMAPGKILALLTALTIRGVIFERNGVYHDREFS